MSQATALSYAALILQDDNIEISADKLQALVDAAGVECETIWSNIFAKALQGKDLASFFLSIGSAPAAGPATTAAPVAASTSAPVSAKEEEKEESDEEMGFGLFD